MINSLLDMLRPETKLTATVTLVGVVTIIISYFIWTESFLVASIYVAIFAPILVLLYMCIDLFMESINVLFAKRAIVKEVQKSTSENSTANNDLYSMA